MVSSSGKRIFVFFGILLMTGCAASGPSITTPVRPGPSVAAPAYKNGDQWVYRVARQTGSKEQLQIAYRNGKFDHDNQDVFDGTIWANVYRTDTDFKPLSFPLSSGKSWNYRYQATSSRGRTAWRDAEVEVIGPATQPVKTPAGQFKAVEIHRVETWGAAERRTTYFYSPETKSVVKLTGNISSPQGVQSYEMELIKFSPGK